MSPVTGWLLTALAVATILLLYALLYLWRRRGDALQDLVTGLANRDFFERYLQHCAARAARLRGRYGFAVVLIDLDDFGELRRALGRFAVDEIVADFAERVFWAVRPSDVMARIGHDAFALVLDDINHIADAARVAMRVQTSLTEAATLSGREIPLSLSIGVAMSRPGIVLDAPEMIADARTAQQTSRETGRPYVIFGEELDAAAQEWLALERVVATGRVGAELEVHFAPAVDPRTFMIRGFSAAFDWADRDPAAGVGGGGGGLDVAMVERVMAHSHAGVHLVEAAIAESWALLLAWNRMTQRKPFVEVRMGSLATRPDPILRVLRKQIAEAPAESEMPLRLAVPVEALSTAGRPFAGALESLRELGVGVHVEIGEASAVPLQLLAEVRPAGVRVEIMTPPDQRVAHRLVHERLLRSCLGLADDVIVSGIESAADMEWLRSLDLNVAAQGQYVSEALDNAAATQIATSGRLPAPRLSPRTTQPIRPLPETE